MDGGGAGHSESKQELGASLRPQIATTIGHGQPTRISSSQHVDMSGVPVRNLEKQLRFLVDVFNTRFHLTELERQQTVKLLVDNLVRVSRLAPADMVCVLMLCCLCDRTSNWKCYV